MENDDEIEVGGSRGLGLGLGVRVGARIIREKYFLGCLRLGLWSWMLNLDLRLS
jgi:hypothetical protein